MKTTKRYFEYGDKELDYLRRKDKRLAAVIDRLGWQPREVLPDLFTALTSAIVGQQISNRVYECIWQRVVNHFGEITPEAIYDESPDVLRGLGLSYRKVDYLQSSARQILTGEFPIASLPSLSDEEVCARLISLDGVGQWTAEMLMLHSLQRPNVLSFGDLGIQRGLRMLYRHRQITRERFERYRRRYAPYGSIASIYLWAISSGTIPELTDPAS